MEILNKLLTTLPAIILGAVIPAGLLLALAFGKDKSKTAFKGAFYGFGSFFGALGILVVVFLIIINVFAVSISVSAESNVNTYIYIGGCVVLAVFYLATEVLKLLSFKSIIKSETIEHAGITFGCGFILAQNLLIIGLRFIADLERKETIFFGVLMLISGVIYVLISTVSYLMVREGQLITGSALSLVYFLIYAVMLIFANVLATYITIAVVLIFVLVVAYVTLPLPFKKGAEQKK